MDNFFRIDIGGDTWNIYLTPDDDNVISEEEAAAETDFENKEMFVREGFITLKRIKHETWHAYMGYCYLHDTNEIGLEDFEEITAGLFSDRGQMILDKANEIHDKLLELKGKLNEIKD